MTAITLRRVARLLEDRFTTLKERLRPDPGVLTGGGMGTLSNATGMNSHTGVWCWGCRTRPQAPVPLAAGNGTPGPTPAGLPFQQQLADLEGKAGRIRRALAALQA